MRPPLHAVTGALLALVAGACTTDIAPPTAATFAPQLDRSSSLQDPPGVATVTGRGVLGTVGGVDIEHGGFGSALANSPSEAGVFYLLTDRGPAFARSGRQVFPLPGFSPHIGRFRLVGNELQPDGTIPLLRGDGTPITGLPHAPGTPGSTNELAVDFDGAELAYDPAGLDPEGLVALTDGSFWLSDEYGPYLLHVDAGGRTLERVTPWSDSRALPSVLARRRINRGMEGLAVLPDGKVLVGAMQSPLNNPTAAVGQASRLARIVWYDTRTGESRQYVYVLEKPAALNSEIVALTQTRLLVLERDGGFPGADAQLKRVYAIDLEYATDVSDPANGAAGRLFDGRTLEQLAPAELATYGVVPVRKALVVDMLERGYAHDKAEGLSVIDNFTIAVSNDDDFGVTDGGGQLFPKLMPALGGARDRNTVYFFRTDLPLNSY